MLQTLIPKQIKFLFWQYVLLNYLLFGKVFSNRLNINHKAEVSALPLLYNPECRLLVHTNWFVKLTSIVTSASLLTVSCANSPRLTSSARAPE